MQIAPYDDNFALSLFVLSPRYAGGLHLEKRVHALQHVLLIAAGDRYDALPAE